MRRREFICLLSGAAVWPFASRAQQAGKVYRIGLLEPTPATQNATNLDALREGLRKLGYVEGKNLVIEYRSADGRAERFPDLASELVRLKVDVMVTRGTPAVQAAQKASGTIPVVMAAMGAPFLVATSLPQPGGNVTGLTTFSQELIGKRIELLKELVPNLYRLDWCTTSAIPWGHLNGRKPSQQRAPWASKSYFLMYEIRKTCIARSNGRSKSVWTRLSSEPTVSLKCNNKRSSIWLPTAIARHPSIARFRRNRGVDSLCAGLPGFVSSSCKPRR